MNTANRPPSTPEPSLEGLASTRIQASLETRVSQPGLGDAPRPAMTPDTEDLMRRFNAADTGFRLMRPLGVGGMGTVFLAEQAQPQRQVALKLIHATQASAEMRARFRLEAEVLGRLKHPGVAEIHAAGEARIDGVDLPYLAMELINGRPLNEWARLREPGLRERVAMLAAICEAVEHAHQRGVIHRDLKPANILVTDADEPKVLDFGVARVTDAGSGLDSQLTTAGFMVGTLHYMSPEQTRGDSNDIDTRSDVYALGVVGFELITGELPHHFDSHDPFVVVHSIRNQSPRRAGQLAAEARGDVEIMLGKALEKDRERRYAGAGALAEDLRRFLDNRSILARPPRIAYRLGKFAQRNPALSFALGVAVLAVFGATFAIGAFALREQQARQLAESEAAKAQATVTFLSSIFSKANPAMTRGQELSVREALQAASQDLAETLAEQPAVEAEVRQTIGASFSALGRYEEAERELRRALQVADSNPGIARFVKVGALRNLSEVLHNQGRLQEARELLLRAAEESRGLGERFAALVLAVDYNLTLIELDLDRAPDLAERSAELLRRARALPQPDPRQLALIMDLHAWAHERADPEAAIAMRREALVMIESRFGELSPDAIHMTDNLATALMRLGAFDEALSLRSDLHERMVQVLGASHPSSINTANNLAHLWSNAGEPSRARELLEQQLSLAEPLPDSLDIRYRLLQGHSAAAFAMGDSEAALRSAHAAVEGLLRLRGERHADSINAMSSLATILALEDRNDEAEPWFERAVLATEQNLGPEHSQTLGTLSEYAAFLRDAGQLDEAIARFKDVLTRLQRLEGDTAPQTLMTIYQFTGALQQAGRHDEALPLTLHLHERAADALGPGNPFALLSPNRHARSLIGVGRLPEAEALLQASLERMRSDPNASPTFIGYVEESMQMLEDARQR